MSQRSEHLKVVSWTRHCTHMPSTVIRSQSKRAPLGCSKTRNQHLGCVCSNCIMLSRQHKAKTLRTVSRNLLICAMKGVQPGTSNMELTDCPVSVHTQDINVFIHAKISKRILLCQIWHFILKASQYKKKQIKQKELNLTSAASTCTVCVCI